MSRHAELRDWAISKRVHPTAYAFLSMYGSMSETGFIYAGPEGWQTVSGTLRRDDLCADDLRGELEEILGTVGAIHFLHFSQLTVQMPDWDRVLSGASRRAPDLYRVDSASGMVLSKTLAAKLKEQFDYIKTSWGSDYFDTDAFADWCGNFNNALQFVENSLQTELVVMFFRDAIKTYGPAVINTRCMPGLTSLMKKYSQLILTS